MAPECASIQCTLREGVVYYLQYGWKGVNGHIVFSLIVELTVRVVILLTGLMSDFDLAVFKTGSFVYHVSDY